MKFPSLAILLITINIGVTAASAADAQELSLRTAIDRALAENLGLRIQTLSPDIAQEAVLAQEATFDPSLFSQANLSQSDLDREDSDGVTHQNTSDSRSYAIGVTKRIKTGAQITASANHSRSDGSSFNSELGQLVGGSLSERASLSLEFTQPLLRDFGSDVNLAPVRRAESQARVADLRTRNSVLDLLQRIENAYWQLSDAHQRRNLRQSNLELSQKLLEEARERERLGLATKIETLQAESNLAQRKEQIIRADQAIQEATDNLLSVMGVLDDSLELAPELNVSQLPVSETPVPSFQATLDKAIERNFDSDIQEEVLEQLEQERILARNSKRPQVDLTVSSSYNGLSPKSGTDAFNEAFDRRGDDWGLRLSFNLPWGARSAKSNLRQTLYRIDQEELRLAEIKQDLLRSVRSAWRALDTSRQQRSAAQLVVALQEATYEQETSKYEEGLSTLRILLEAQRDLDQANLSLLDARLATVQAEITLARVEGTLLERHGIEWNDTLPETKQ